MTARFTSSETAALVGQERGTIRNVLELMPYGMYAVGSSRAGEPNIMIADWVMQVSFSPHLVALAFENDSYTLASIRENHALTINLLSIEQMSLASRFVQPLDGRKVKGRTIEAAHRYEKLTGVPYRQDKHGCPLLSESLAWMIAEAQEFVPAGDHTLVIAHVVDAAELRSGDPLTSVNSGWSYAG